MTICMCGATDCPACHPEMWYRGIYLGDGDEEAIQRAFAEAEDAAGEAWADRMAALEWGAE